MKQVVIFKLIIMEMGGAGNDAIQATPQSDIITCNAFYTPSPDGGNPAITMFACGIRDGSFDNHVIVHEYGHGISNRLTGGANNSNCLGNIEQMGEGWSDWYGNMLTMSSGDMGEDPIPIGNWLVGNGENAGGIRDFPYSTDLNVDPRTYSDISSSSIPHGVGSVWAAMLWEMTWLLIDEYGFDDDLYNGTGGNNIALALVTEALKLQPCRLGFVDGRDAILDADIALYNGDNQCIIWEAFAKRGLGFNADQGSSDSVVDGSENFDLPVNSITLPNEVCFDEGIQTLSGGSPFGGVYSGTGVTDNGNGIDFTFDPNVTGIGQVIVNYTLNTTSQCGQGGDEEVQTQLNVIEDEPFLICQDFTLGLDENGEASLLVNNVVNNLITNDYEIQTNGVFAVEDISANGTNVNLGDDQVSGVLPIGFSFMFFDIEYTEFVISSNGFISFTSTSPQGCCIGQSIPDASTPNNLIAAAWEDLNPNNGGTIRYEQIGSAPNRILIVEYVNVPFFGSSATTVSSQIKLFEGSNTIEIHSMNIDNDGGSVTQGIENFDGTEAYTLTDRNSAVWTATNDFVAFTFVTDAFCTYFLRKYS